MDGCLRNYVRKMSYKEILEDISSICYKIEAAKRKDLHESLVDALKEYFTSHGYQCIEEYVIPFISTKRGSIGRSKKKRQINLVVKKNESLIFAIEFDTGNTLKYKSIEKLFQSGASILIGVIRGNLKIPINVLKQMNVDRLKTVIEEYRQIKGTTPYYKALYLIILSYKTSFRIFMTMELLSGQNYSRI